MKTINKNLINYSLSNIDIAMYLDNPNIVKYADLDDNFDSIDQVFDGYPYVIILIESGLNKGHWCCLTRYGNSVEIFDSYGGTIDHELSFISKKMKAKLGEADNCLATLLKKSSYKTIVSKHKFQSESDNVDTCGRHVVLRILMFLCGGMHLKQYTNWFKNNAKLLNLRNDEFVCKCITF